LNDQALLFLHEGPSKDYRLALGWVGGDLTEL
jgi:hypothetical protein